MCLTSCAHDTDQSPYDIIVIRERLIMLLFLIVIKLIVTHSLALCLKISGVVLAAVTHGCMCISVLRWQLNLSAELKQSHNVRHASGSALRRDLCSYCPLSKPNRAQAHLFQPGQVTGKWRPLTLVNLNDVFSTKFERRRSSKLTRLVRYQHSQHPTYMFKRE